MQGRSSSLRKRLWDEFLYPPLLSQLHYENQGFVYRLSAENLIQIKEFKHSKEKLSTGEHFLSLF